MTADDVILACYELAKYYGIDPRVFLEQPLSEVARHRYWTYKLADRIRSAQQDAEASDQ